MFSLTQIYHCNKKYKYIKNIINVELKKEVLLLAWIHKKGKSGQKNIKKEWNLFAWMERWSRHYNKQKKRLLSSTNERRKKDFTEFPQRVIIVKLAIGNSVNTRGRQNKLLLLSLSKLQFESEHKVGSFFLDTQISQFPPLFPGIAKVSSFVFFYLFLHWFLLIDILKGAFLQVLITIHHRNFWVEED